MIDSKGRLDAFRDDIQPIDEINELLTDSNKKVEEMRANRNRSLLMDPTPTPTQKQELFELRPLLLTSQILKNNSEDNHSSLESDDETPMTFREDEWKVHRIQDYMNLARRFNRKNLQQCQQKNKQLIAFNMRQQNEIRQQLGYNACLMTGKK